MATTRRPAEGRLAQVVLLPLPRRRARPGGARPLALPLAIALATALAAAVAIST